MPHDLSLNDVEDPKSLLNEKKERKKTNEQQKRTCAKPVEATYPDGHLLFKVTFISVQYPPLIKINSNHSKKQPCIN